MHACMTWGTFNLLIHDHIIYSTSCQKIMDLLGIHVLDTGERRCYCAALATNNNFADDKMVIVRPSLVQTSPIPAQELDHSGGQGCSLYSTVHACCGWYCD